jgi:hypothetical protein
MAKDRAKVPTINISNQKAGMAYGGVIYSSDVSVGYNAESTKLNINAVLDTKLSKSRNFLITKNDLDLTSPVNINIADSEMFRNMFLTSYSINTGVDNKVLNLTYSDGSVLLDRIFVGLIHEHFQVNKEKHLVPNLVKFDVFCPQIEQTNTGPVCSQDGTTLHKDVKVMKKLASPTGVAGRPYVVYPQNRNNIWEGGYMVLGREEFSEVECDIRDVSYGFEDFLSALSDVKNGFGIAVDSSRYIKTKDSNLLLRTYSGTVKDVLQNWGNDLSISYYWDFTKDFPTLVIISNADRSVDVKVDETASAITALDKGQEGGTSSSNLSDIVINSKNENVTLDGTFTQAFSSTFNVGPRAKTESKRKTSKIYFDCQTIDSIIASGISLGRTPRDIKTSCALGKYAPDLRDAWNARKAIITHMNSGLDAARGYYRAIGFDDVIAVNYGKDLSRTQTRHIMDTANLTQLIGSHSPSNGTTEQAISAMDGYKMFIGVYDESLKNLSTSIESEIADSFLGRHYLYGAPRSESLDFTGSSKIQETTETKPSSQYYSLNQHYKTPLAKFAKKIQDLRLNKALETDEVYRNKLYDELNQMQFDALDECNQKKTDKSLYKDAFKRGFYHFEREAPWATFQEDVESLLNPYKLSARPFFDAGDNSGVTHFKDDIKERVKSPLMKEYVPFHSEPPMLSTVSAIMPPKLHHMILEGEATDKKFVIVLVKGDDPAGTVSLHKIGDILIGYNFKGDVVDYDRSGRKINQTVGGVRNPIEEINALRSLCDRHTNAMSDMAAELKTTCERDFVEELCSSKLFGQTDKTCGEAQAIADSLYDLELQTDNRKGHNAKEGIYADCITLRRVNRDVGVEAFSSAKIGSFDKGEAIATQKLYSDVKVGLSGSDKVDIIYPSENAHNGMLVYNRESTITDLGVRKVFDPINGARVPINKRSSAVKYQVKDITQDITSVINEDNKQKILEGEVPTNIIADVDNIQGQEGDTTYTELQNMSADAYHQRLKGNVADLQVEEPRKSYTFTIYVDSVGGLNTLISYLKPENGLESLSISMSEGGFSINVNLSNRASADVQLEQIYRKVGPVAKEVGAKFSTLRSV